MSPKSKVDNIQKNLFNLLFSHNVLAMPRFDLTLWLIYIYNITNTNRAVVEKFQNFQGPNDRFWLTSIRLEIDSYIVDDTYFAHLAKTFFFV